MRRGRFIGVTVASLAALAVPGAMPAESGAFCEPLQASWVKAGLPERPTLRDLGAHGRLSGGRLVILQLGAHNKLVVEGGPVGYAFATRSGRLTLGWRVAIRLVHLTFGEFNNREETVALRRRHIGTVTVDRPGLIGLRVPPRHGLFRVELSIRSRKGKFLGMLGRYLIGVTRTLDARLDTDRPVYSPGEEVRSEIENIGTQGISFKPFVRLQRKVDGQWVRVGFGAPPRTAGGSLEGGQIGGCARFRLPADAPPGPYRAVRSIEVGRSGVKTTVTAPFTVE